MDARLCLITPDSACVAAALDGGVELVQLRNKEIDDAAFLEQARELAVLCKERGVPLILNDRVQLVKRAGADGAHVGEHDMPPEQARNLLGPDLLLGVSTHNRKELEQAAARGADYAGLGPMFATETKRLTRIPGGAALVRSTERATNLPVFCIGGINAGNLGELIDAGATRFAVSAAICSAPDPRAAAAEIARLIRPDR